MDSSDANPPNSKRQKRNDLETLLSLPPECLFLAMSYEGRATATTAYTLSLVSRSTLALVKASVKGRSKELLRVTFPEMIGVVAAAAGTAGADDADNAFYGNLLRLLLNSHVASGGLAEHHGGPRPQRRRAGPGFSDVLGGDERQSLDKIVMGSIIGLVVRLCDHDGRLISSITLGKESFVIEWDCIKVDLAAMSDLNSKFGEDVVAATRVLRRNFMPMIALDLIMKKESGIWCWRQVGTNCDVLAPLCHRPRRPPPRYRCCLQSPAPLRRHRCRRASPAPLHRQSRSFPPIRASAPGR